MKKLTKLGRVTLFQLKFDLKMKLTTFLLIVSLFQIHANNSYGQNTKITLNLENVSLEETLNEIEALSEFKFMYNDKNVDYKKVISINVRNESISKILDKLFSDTSIFYEVLEKQIVLKPKPTSTSLSKSLEKSIVTDTEENLQLQISGMVVDENGLALPGVSVVILGTTNGTATDFDGNYTIEANQGDVLEFSYLGMKTSQATVSVDTTINMTLVATASTLNEVVIIGYGTRRKKDLTGSIGVITSEDLTKEVKMTPELAIQGKMSGVFVSNPGADPNARPTIRIRGVGTLGFNDPLYVIDGVPITEANASSDSGRDATLRGNINIMNLINPDDIESISVLKDASATAIYGVRASNGVILIQTKRGRAGKTRVTFSQSYGVQNLRKRYDVLNTTDYVSLYNEAWANNTAIGRGDDPFGALYDSSSPDYLGNNATYNWIDSAINSSAAIQNYNIGISGGSDKSNFAVGVGYTNQESVIFSSKFERYSFSINSDHKINNWLTLGQSYRMALSRTKREPLDVENLFLDAVLINPWQPLFDSSSDGFALPGRDVGGSFTPNGYGNSTRDNFLGTSQFLYDTQSLLRNLGSFYAEITPLKNIRLRGTYSVDHYSNEYDRLFLPENNLYSTQGGDLDSRGARFENRRTENLNLVAEFLVGYNNSFGKHNVDLIFNAMDQKTYWNVNSLSAINTGITSFDQRLIPEGLDPGFKTSFLERRRSGLQGYMGRFSYNYDSKYYIDGTVRHDGSSKFGPGYKWGTFPAIGVAWRVSSEKFMENATWLDDLKFRVGWGQTGNQETKPFGFLSLVNNNPTYALGSNGNPGEGNLNPAIALGDFPIIDTTWETSTSTNIAFDATMFDNRVTFTAEYYKKDTEGILQAINIPQVIGALNSPVVNLANVVNKGFEFQLGYNDQFGEIGFDVNFNLTTVDNDVTKLYNNSPQGSDLARIEVGYPIGYIYGYKTDGIFQTQQEVDAWLATNSSPGNTGQLAPGDFIFQDLYGEPTAADGEFAYRSEGSDNVVNQLDRTYLGKTIPGYYYGLALGVDYKGFDLGLAFRGVGDVQKVNFERIAGESISNGGANFFTSVQNRWTPTNPSNTFPRAVADDPSGNNRLSDRWVEDADFFRLQNLQLGYTFGDNVLNGFGASNFRIYASFSNVFVITPYSGLDPEHDTTPTTMTLGFNIGF